MCNKAVDNYPHALEFVPECFTTQGMCDEVFNKSFLAFFYILGRYKTQQMCDRIISNVHLLPRCIPDQ